LTIVVDNKDRERARIAQDRDDLADFWSRIYKSVHTSEVSAEAQRELADIGLMSQVTTTVDFISQKWWSCRSELT